MAESYGKNARSIKTRTDPVSFAHSMINRNLCNALRCRTAVRRKREMSLRVVVANIMISHAPPQEDAGTEGLNRAEPTPFLRLDDKNENRPRSIAIDEVGYLTLDTTQASFVFQVIADHSASPTSSPIANPPPASPGPPTARSAPQTESPATCYTLNS
jgi:hypothetical protein